MLWSMVDFLLKIVDVIVDVVCSINSYFVILLEKKLVIILLK